MRTEQATTLHAPARASRTVPTTGRPPTAPEIGFFGLGAPKCRTTWMAQCLDEHPEITIARKKEPNFFVRRREIWTDAIHPDYLTDWSWYADQFAHARPGDLLGDFSVNLMSNIENGPRLVQRHYPDARFLVLLRDPVTRAYSEWWHGWGRLRHVYPVPDTFEEAIDDFPVLTLRSEYHRQLSTWMERFAPDRFLILLGRDLDEPAAAVRRVYDFLGIDPDVQPPSLQERINGAHHRRGLMWKVWNASSKLRRAGLGPVINVVKRLGVERTLDRIDRSGRGPPPIDKTTETRLRHHFLPDVQQLEALIGRDLTHWKPDETG